MLLNSNFSLEFTTNKGYSAIHLCCMLDRTEILHEIIHYLKTNQYKSKYIKKLLNTMNNQCSISPLSFAILQNNPKIAIMLIQNGSKSYFNQNSV